MIVSSSVVTDKSESFEKFSQDLLGFIHQSVRDGTSFPDFETAIFKRMLLLGGVATDHFLSMQGNGDLGKTIPTKSGILNRSSKVQTRKLRSIFKEHCFESYVYSAGVKQKIELRPIDARLSLPAHKASHLLQEFTQLLCVEKAFGKAAAQFEQLFGQTISVDVLESINRDLGTQADQFLDDHLTKPEPEKEGKLLILTADGKGVPLVKPDAQKVPAFDKKERPGNRRMATLGCIYSVDRFTRTPEQIVASLFRHLEQETIKVKRPEARSKHYRSYFSYGPEGEEPIPGSIRTWTWLAQQAARRHQKGQPIIRLMDGQQSLWDAAHLCLDEFVQEHKNAGQDLVVVDILDILHVSGYVWKAAKAFHDHKEHQEAFAQERLLKILRGEVAGVIKGLRNMATRNQVQGDRLKEIESVCTYFENNTKRMRYDEYLREGYPIATGVIEGACRHVIKDRMEQGGMRWTLEGAEAMLNFRAVNASSQVETFHVWRKKEEVERIHPHRKLVAGYQEFTA